LLKSIIFIGKIIAAVSIAKDKSVLRILVENKNKEKIYTFNLYLRRIFNERVQRISLDAGFSCPNIDGEKSSSGCNYCNNKAFSIYSRSKKLEEQIQESLEFYGKRFGVKKFIAYFQAFTNTRGPVSQLRKTYDVIKKYPQIVGLFISTRPDSVDQDIIKLIAEYKRDYLVWMEYGLQTTDDDVLSSINRNHTYNDFLSALEVTKSYDIDVCAHIIIGLPGSNQDTLAKDVERIAKLGLGGLKFHVFHILKDTLYEKMHLENKIKLMTKEEYVRDLTYWLERISKDVVVMRLVSTASEKYLIAPEWINDKHAVIKAVNDELEKRKTYQGCYYENTTYTNF
jgi:uncharacterized protein